MCRHLTGTDATRPPNGFGEWPLATGRWPLATGGCEHAPAGFNLMRKENASTLSGG